jgi:cytochrome oxidase Cu insertion factor (SCO1/SenC/PrrC family)
MRFVSRRTLGNISGSASRLRFGAILLAINCLLALSTVSMTASAINAKPFKPFKLKTLDGQKRTLADYTDKLTLVAFFYPRCPYCKVSVTHVQQIYDKYKDRGLAVVLINIVEDEDKLIPRFMKENGLSLPVLTGAWQPSLIRDYDLETTPTHFLLDSKGAVLLRQDGYNPGDEKALETRIAMGLKKS